MAENTELLLDKLEHLLSRKRSTAYYSKKLNLPIERIYELKQELKERKEGNIEDKEECTRKVNVEKGTLESTKETTFDPQDVDQLAKLHKIDLTRYKISSYWSKLKSNGKFTSSVFATLKKPNEYTAEDFAKFLEGYEPKPVKLSIVETDIAKKKVDVEISIADFHIDRKTLAEDTFEERKNEYRRLVEQLLIQVQGAYEINHLVFVIGNDYFNTDSYHNTTTNLTPQEVTVPWHKAYEEGFELLVETITKVSHVAEKTTVVLVQGNHDRTKSFYLAHALEVFFKSYYRPISFLRENSNTKYVVLGETFIGYHHGNHIKIDSLPLYFATDDKSSVDFGFATYREVHTGDKHFYMAKDIQGVRIQQIPSMVKPDNFTNDGLYIHVKAGLALCYDPVKGKCAEFEVRL